MRVLPTDETTRALRLELISQLENAPTRCPDDAVLSELKGALSSNEPRLLEVTILARRLAEATALIVLGEGAKRLNLYDSIERTREHGVAPWIATYLHTLRVLGNEVAHERRSARRTPPHPTEEDSRTLLLCLLRVASFLRDWDLSKRSSGDRVVKR